MKDLVEALIGRHNIKGASSRYRYTDLKEKKDLKYEDLLKEGNVIEFKEDSNIYHGIVVSSSVARDLYYIHSSVILTPHENENTSYWKATDFKDHFPMSISGSKVVKVYRLDRDISDLRTKKDFYDLFIEYGLIFMKREY